MPTSLKLLGNVATTGYAEGTYKTRFVLNQATAATGSATFVIPYAGTVTGVFASALCTQSSDRTDTITVTKRPQNVAVGSAVNVLGTAGVISSNNVSGSITRSIGSTGVTAFTTSVNPVLTSTAADLALVAGDTITITNTGAGSNGSAATQLSVVVEVVYNLGNAVGT